MNYIGIDPGKSGAIAIINGDGSVATAPFSEEAYLDMITRHSCHSAVVEDVHAMPRQGVTSMFSFGQNKGWILGLLYAFQIPVTLVSPQRWKRYNGLDTDKQKSILLAKTLYPNACLLATPRCKKPADGIAEAILMADYCKRLNENTL